MQLHLQGDSLKDDINTVPVPSVRHFWHEDILPFKLCNKMVQLPWEKAQQYQDFYF